MLYWFLRWLLNPLARLIFRPRVEGLANIPDKGPAIIASNHLAVMDSFFLPIVARRRITFLAKSEYFTGRGVKGWLQRAFFRGVGQVPIDRGSAAGAKAALDEGLRLLAQGRLLGIYPEGTRSPDGRLYQGKTGVARLALESGAPIIPVAMVGTDRVQPLGTVVPRIHRVEIRIGKPLDFSRYEGMAGDGFVERSVTDELLYELMKLSGQEYADIYAARVKAVMARTGQSAREVTASLCKRPADADTSSTCERVS